MYLSPIKLIAIFKCFKCLQNIRKPLTFDIEYVNKQFRQI